MLIRAAHGGRRSTVLSLYTDIPDTRQRACFHISHWRSADERNEALDAPRNDENAPKPFRPRLIRQVKIRSPLVTRIKHVEVDPLPPKVQYTDKHNLSALAAAIALMAQQMKEKEIPQQEMPASEIDGAGLPISPLEKAMDAAAKKKPKRKPTQEETGHLAHNPWAAMLAAPLRQDVVSKTRLPVSLLINMNEIKSPNDEDVYIMPTDMGDLQAFNERLKTAKRSNAMKPSATADDGNSLRMLPYNLLLEELTDSVMAWDTKTGTGKTKKGSVSRRLIPGRWLEKQQKLAAYRGASKEYWDLKEQQGELDDDLFKRPTKGINYADLQWSPSITGRVANIMRQRVLLALNHIAEKQHRPAPQYEAYTFCFKWPTKAEIDMLSFQATANKQRPTSNEDFWNDMGDIESPDAISGGGSRQGNQRDPRPPIAVPPSEVGQDPTLSQPENDASHTWLPGSFILHIGPASASLKALRRLNQLPVSSLNTDDPMDSAFQPSKYIPSMMTVADHHRLPVFSLAAMLDSRLFTVLRRILNKHWQLRPDGTPIFDRDGTPRSAKDLDYIILVKSTAPGAHFLAQELWQLWRYLGGRDCLTSSVHVNDRWAFRTAMNRAMNHDPINIGRAKKTYSSYTGLSDNAWEHLHKLLGLKSDKSSSKDEERAKDYSHYSLTEAERRIKLRGH